MPTTLELAQIDKPDHVEFQSLLPLLDGQSSQYDEIYGCYLGLQRSIRTDQYKLIAYPKAGVLRLYDIENDPLEQKDLIDEPEMLPKAKGLFVQLLDLQRQMNDRIDLTQLAPK